MPEAQQKSLTKSGRELAWNEIKKGNNRSKLTLQTVIALIPCKKGNTTPR